MLQILLMALGTGLLMGLLVGLAMLLVFSVWWSWLVFTLDLEEILKPPSAAERAGLAAAELHGVGSTKYRAMLAQMDKEHALSKQSMIATTATLDRVANLEAK